MTKRHRKGRPTRPAEKRGYGWRLAFILSALGVGVLALILLQSGAFRGGAGEEEHGHPPSPHGGLIVSLGPDDRYHVEAVLETEGLLKLYTLGEDVTKVLDVPSQTVEAQLKVDGEKTTATILLMPMPQTGDPDGKTSRFMGKLPPEFRGRPLAITVPALVVAGERFRLEFASARPTHGIGTAAQGQEKLYLTPGGLYTDDDIRANGGVPAGRKYAGVRANHDVRPRAGDRVCPVTRTKANPEFTWVVAGKTYEFCCPPCVDEFVGWAREMPERVKDPDAYVKE